MVKVNSWFKLFAGDLDLHPHQKAWNRETVEPAPCCWMGSPSIHAWFSPLAWTDGEVTTAEGLASNGKLDILQEKFIEHSAPQCGYCAPGYLCRQKRCLREIPTQPNLKCAKLLQVICATHRLVHYVQAIHIAAAANQERKDG